MHLLLLIDSFNKEFDFEVMATNECYDFQRQPLKSNFKSLTCNVIKKNRRTSFGICCFIHFVNNHLIVA